MIYKKYNTSANELVCKKHGVLMLSELINLVPGSIYLSKNHIEVCCLLASDSGFSGELLMVYVNLLVVHSKKAKIFTALVELILAKKIEPVSISSTFLNKEHLGAFVNINGMIFSGINTDTGLLNDKSLKRLFVKYLMHRLYRLNFRKNKRANTAIRSWVEITQNMYGEYYDSSLVLIYPFYYNLRRHLKYIAHCFRSYNSVSLCGLPYSFKDLLKIFFYKKNSDLYTVFFEANAYKKHAVELQERGVLDLYTSDEFEAGSVVMASKLRAEGIYVKNTSHGLGFNCPYVGYNTFQVYNSAQKAYYKFKSPDTNFLIAPRINTNMMDRIQSANSANPILIFLEANFEAVNLFYESELQEKSIRHILDIAEKQKITFTIKAHPNRKDCEIQKMGLKYSTSVIRSLAVLSEVAPIFITINSAAYYDFRSQGPFIFVNDGYSNLEDFYGESLQSHSVEKIESEIKRLMSLPLNESIH